MSLTKKIVHLVRYEKLDFDSTGKYEGCTDFIKVDEAKEYLQILKHHMCENDLVNYPQSCERCDKCKKFKEILGAKLTPLTENPGRKG